MRRFTSCVLLPLLVSCGARSSLFDVPFTESDGGASSGGTSSGASNGGASSGGAPAGAGGANAGSGGTMFSSCVPNPCLHGGACAIAAGMVSCDCLPGFVGSQCELPRFELLEMPDACNALPNAFFVPTDLSGDGSVMVGYCSASFMPTGQPPDLAFRWSRAEGYVQLSPPGSTTTRTSYDGAVTAGAGTGSDRFGAPQPIPILWRGGTAENLSAATGTAASVSGNGSFTVGDAFGIGALRWSSAASFAILPVPAGAKFCSPVDTNGDGTVTVGICDTTRGVVWYNDGSATLLDPIAGTTAMTGLRLSASGLVVAGAASDFAARNGATYAFRWTAAGGSLVLDPNGDSSYVNDISSDGAVIVGARNDPSLVTSARPAVWLSGERQDLETVLAGAGADLAGWSLESVVAVSDDGALVVGVAYTGGDIDHSRPYLAHLSATR